VHLPLKRDLEGLHILLIKQVLERLVLKGRRGGREGGREGGRGENSYTCRLLHFEGREGGREGGRKGRKTKQTHTYLHPSNRGI
jgi:hypothetical protein